MALGENSLDILVRDEGDGASTLTALLQRADGTVDTLDSFVLDQNTVTSFVTLTIEGVDVQAGDQLLLDGLSNAGEPLRIDAVQFNPQETAADTPTDTPTDPAPDGSDGDDGIEGGIGDDVIDGGPGDDQILGQTGDDILSGGDGNDELFGNGGADSLFGDAGADVLNGNGGNDVLIGGTGADALNGGTGNDFLSGDGGSDTLFGGTGNDFLVGGGGSDTFVFTAPTSGSSFDVIDDFQVGIDSLDVSDLASSFGELTIVDTGSNVAIFFSEDQAVTFNNITDIEDLSADDFIF